MVPIPADDYSNLSRAQRQANQLREARQARAPTIFSGPQSTLGKKRHFNDTEEEAEAEKPMHKRKRAKRTRQTTDDAYDNDETRDLLQNGPRVRLQSTFESPLERQDWERRYLCVDAVNSAHDGTDETKQHKTSGHDESFGIDPDHSGTARPRGIIHVTNHLHSTRKNVRFEDEFYDYFPEKPICFGKIPSGIQQQTARASSPQILGAIQREDPNQPADADVDMVDIEAELTAP
ncbi:hypothetical protein diail_2090 [Diaporthe ilicicola]|nr:hypothetical protein diail_2090 [Diaporthe ilicicola]